MHLKSITVLRLCSDTWKKVCLEHLITKHWVRRLSGRKFQVIGPTTRECPTTEIAVTMSWKDELVAADREKPLTAGDIQSRCAAVHEVLESPALKTPVNTHQVYTGYVQERPASAAQSDIAASGHGQTSQYH